MPSNHKESTTLKTHRHVVRVGGILKEIVTITDATGSLMHKFVRPLMLEFHLHDVFQIIIGAMLLATPIVFTQEVWELGTTLPLRNIVVLSVISIFLLSAFVYYNSYRSHLRGYEIEFLKRVISIYLISLVVVGTLLTILGQAPWTTEFIVAIKRTILVAFPASMSAAVADMIK
jgi:uncharacterized membrane protein